MVSRLAMLKAQMAIFAACWVPNQLPWPSEERSQ